MLTRIATPLTLAVALTGLAAAPVPMESKPPAELLKAQRDAARKAYELCIQGYQKGIPSIDVEKCYLWSRRWMEAERQLADDKKADRAALAAHLDRMEKLELNARALLQAGAPTVSALDGSAATFYRAEAETWLAQVKGK